MLSWADEAVGDDIKEVANPCTTYKLKHKAKLLM
jgi:hypothetical protein